MNRPLTGKRVLVTRAAHQAGKLSDALRDAGAQPVEVPLLEIRPPLSFDALDRALGQIDTYEWIILTSANAVRALTDRAGQLSINLQQVVTLKVAAIGPSTAAEARKANLEVALIPEAYVAESLLAGLETQIAGKRVLLARAAIARDVIPDSLRAAGATVDVVDAYRNVTPEAAPAHLRQALDGGIDAVTFTSSSSVTHLAEAARQAGLAFPLPGVSAISIGPITSQTLRELDCEPAIEASPSDIPGLIAATADLLTR